MLKNIEKNKVVILTYVYLDKEKSDKEKFISEKLNNIKDNIDK